MHFGIRRRVLAVGGLEFNLALTRTKNNTIFRTGSLVSSKGEQFVLKIVLPELLDDGGVGFISDLGLTKD